MIRALCQQLDELQSKVVSEEDRAELEAIIAAALAGENAAVGAGDIESRRSALAAHLGLRTRRRRSVGLTGLGPGHTTPDIYICPSNKCSRTWLNVPGKGDPPLCGLTNQPLCKG
ncbi:hypothetical protein GCM10010361_15430 [Streptomyces olivaceiscleroticus]|uniref:Uncharacterized protein n=1 Tax=Streptomyces olivaceiscleroticus TaxID=68245 RepID=A0ABN0ZNB9_9ACTN